MEKSETKEAELFRRGKEVLGKQAGGLLAKLLRCKNQSIEAAMDAIEAAAEKENPREFIGAIVRNMPAYKGVRGDDWW